MSEGVKQEFFRWMRSLVASDLSDTQIRILNIFIAHFGALSLLGTAGGKRAKKISEIIQAQHTSLTAKLPDLNENQTEALERADHIAELEIGPFRGFRSKEKFIFNKKYAFLYGPNGSGKSSFCEGLEYALLGDIEEAAAKRIPLVEYIRNTEKNTASIPTAYSVVAGEKRPIPQNQALYRFSFVEKNRIDGFARITAATPGVQKDRIATLFGLDAFSEFVDGFTDNFQQYLPLEPTKGKAFEAEQKVHGENIARLEQIGKDIEQGRAEIDKLIQILAKPGIDTAENMQHFLVGKDGVSGKINQLQQSKAEKIPEDISLEPLEQLPLKIAEAQSLLIALESDLAKFQASSSEVNFKDLYSAVTAVADSPKSDQSFCPACKTPLTQVTVDPFAYARTELAKLKSLVELQKNIPQNARSIARLINIAKTLLQTINDNSRKAGYLGQALSSINEIDNTDISAIPTWTKALSQELASILKQNVVLEAIKTSINNYNVSLAAKRAKQNDVDGEIRTYQEFNTRRIELTTAVEILSGEKTKINLAIQVFTETNTKKLAEIEAEKKLVKIYQGFCDAYISLVANLKTYRNKLPQELSTGLSEKIVEYYNHINLHDPEFERLASLSMPATAGDKITLQFIGEDAKKAALHVLSEGHIKVLGLSILLAKIVHEKLGFIIFDDIVNSIDDDHRSGIADLLLIHPDFIGKQQIITCHGEQFINKLEHRLGASATTKEVTRYRFYPMDSIAERGINLSIGDAKHYLVQAQEAFAKNSLKDAASKCRQAVESVSETLWKKLGKEKSISLTVKMRAPGAQPDLSTVVDSLIKELKRVDEKSVIYTTLKNLKDKYPWSILNKGAHEQDSSPEFDRTDIDSVLKLLGALDQEVAKVKFATIISVDG